MRSRKSVWIYPRVFHSSTKCFEESYGVSKSCSEYFFGTVRVRTGFEFDNFKLLLESVSANAFPDQTVCIFGNDDPCCLKEGVQTHQYRLLTCHTSLCLHICSPWHKPLFLGWKKNYGLELSRHELTSKNRRLRIRSQELCNNFFLCCGHAGVCRIFWRTSKRWMYFILLGLVVVDERKQARDVVLRGRRNRILPPLRSVLLNRPVQEARSRSQPYKISGEELNFVSSRSVAWFLQEQTTHIIVLTPKALNFLNSCSHWDGLFWYLVDKSPWNYGPIDANSLTLRGERRHL